MRLKCLCLYPPPQIWLKGIPASHHSDSLSQNHLHMQCCPPVVLSLPHKLSWGYQKFLLWQSTAVIRRWISGSWSSCRRQHMRDLQRQIRAHDLLGRTETHKGIKQFVISSLAGRRKPAFLGFHCSLISGSIISNQVAVWEGAIDVTKCHHENWAQALSTTGCGFTEAADPCL